MLNSPESHSKSFKSSHILSSRELLPSSHNIAAVKKNNIKQFHKLKVKIPLNLRYFVWRFILILCMSILPAYKYNMCMSAWRSQNLLEHSTYRQLLTIMWALKTKPRFSGTVVTLNPWASYPIPVVCTLTRENILFTVSFKNISSMIAGWTDSTAAKNTVLLLLRTWVLFPMPTPHSSKLPVTPAVRDLTPPYFMDTRLKCTHPTQRHTHN